MTDIDFYVLQEFNKGKPLSESELWVNLHRNIHIKNTFETSGSMKALELTFYIIFDTDSYDGGVKRCIITEKGIDVYKQENESRKKEAKLKSIKDWKEEHWIRAEAIKHLSSAIIGGIIGGLFVLLSTLQCNHQSNNKQQEKKADTLSRNS